MITASILSKKLVEDLDGLVMDIKVGRGAFMQTLDDAHELAESMMCVARQVGLKMKILFTNMDNPLGRTVGNWIEVEECESALRDYDSCSEDMRELSVALAARMLMIADGLLGLEEASGRVRNAWTSGQAHEYFLRMIGAQGGDLLASKEKYKVFPDDFVCADRDGFIASFKTREIGIAAVELGAGRKQKEDVIDYVAGFTLLKNVGDEVRQGDAVVRVQASTDARFGRVRQLLLSTIEIGDAAQAALTMILEEWTT